jgi:NAD(P)H-dependent FMN reductase
MRLLVLDGSPRAPRSNTGLLLDAVLRGFGAAGGVVVARHALARPSGLAAAVRDFPEADAVLVGFPLYVDAMPAPVMSFIEALAPRVGVPNPDLLFVVQSGFPEAVHSRPIERWLAKLARRLGARHLGTVVRPGTEGIRVRPRSQVARAMRPLEALGRGLALTGRLDPAILEAVAGLERFGEGPTARLRLAVAGVVTRWFWNRQLRAHGALADRDAAPYAPSAGDGR